MLLDFRGTSSQWAITALPFSNYPKPVDPEVKLILHRKTYIPFSKQPSDLTSCLIDYTKITAFHENFAIYYGQTMDSPASCGQIQSAARSLAKLGNKGY